MANKMQCSKCGEMVIPVEGVSAIYDCGYWWHAGCCQVFWEEGKTRVCFPYTGKLLCSTIMTNTTDHHEIITVWCVKYALTNGIFQLKGEVNPDGYFHEDCANRLGYCLSKNEYRLTLEDAKIAAEELRKRKIKSLEKQLSNVMTKEIRIKP